MDFFEEPCLLPNTAIFYQESQMEINATAQGWLSFISFHIDTTSCRFQFKCTRKIFNSVKLLFFIFQEPILLFQKKIIFISPTTRRMRKKKRSTSGQELNNNNVGGFYISYRFRTR